jgi:hypothetical protein
MGGKIVEKLKKKQAILAKYQETLVVTKKQKKKPTKIRHISGEEFLSRHPVIRPFLEFAIRTPNAWICRTYNDDRRLRSFVEHLFCKYPIPSFLYTIFEEPKQGWIDGRHYGGEDERSVQNLRLWAVILGTGHSFRKESKGVFTAQESHLFLNAPANNTAIQNAWWAKCMAAGWNRALIATFLRKVDAFQFVADNPHNKKYTGALHFFARHMQELDKETLSDLMDYIAILPLDFDFAGRTMASMIRMSNEWHALGVYEKDPLYKEKWPPYPIADWKEHLGGRLWQVIQLLSGKDLLYEAKIQHHCVGNYSYRCVHGGSRIFTLHSTDKDGNVRKHITIELHPETRSIVQTRGKFNRQPFGDEKQAINLWAAQNGVKPSRWY